MKRSAWISMLLSVALVAAWPVLAADAGHYLLGNLKARTPGAVQPGLLLMAAATAISMRCAGS